MTKMRNVRSTTSLGLGAACLLALSTLPSHADAINYVSGAAGLFNLTTSTQLANVREGNNESAKDFFWFAEKQGVSISGLAVDDATGGANPPGHPGTLTGTVNSYMLYTDQLGKTGSTSYNITVKFTQKILGVITDSSTLKATDSTLGRSGTSYPGLGSGQSTRGQEFPDTTFWTVADNTLTLHNVTSDNVNEIRVLTAVPEASTMLGFGALLGAGSFGLLRSRRVRKIA